jgi:hypothetical protein
MSDSWIFWKPRIDEPSKLTPSSKYSGPNVPTGTVKCCMMPGRVAEANVDELDALILDIGQQVVGSLEHLSSGEIVVPWHALWLRASGTQMDILLNLEQLAYSTLSRKLDECGPWLRRRLLESLMESRFLSSCTNVSHM